MGQSHVEGKAYRTSSEHCKKSERASLVSVVSFRRGGGAGSGSRVGTSCSGCTRSHVGGLRQGRRNRFRTHEDEGHAGSCISWLIQVERYPYKAAYPERRRSSRSNSRG
jgi:hypothetical protein